VRKVEADQRPEGTLSMLESVHALLGELPGIVSDRVHLFALELARGSQALGQMLLLALCAVILAGTCWVALCGGLALAAVHAGMHWSVALAAVITVNAALAFMIFRRVVALSALLRMPATLRHLTLASHHLPAGPAETPNTVSAPVSQGRV